MSLRHGRPHVLHGADGPRAVVIFGLLRRLGAAVRFDLLSPVHLLHGRVDLAERRRDGAAGSEGWRGGAATATEAGATGGGATAAEATGGGSGGSGATGPAARWAPARRLRAPAAATGAGDGGAVRTFLSSSRMTVFFWLALMPHSFARRWSSLRAGFAADHRAYGRGLVARGVEVILRVAAVSSGRALCSSRMAVRRAVTQSRSRSSLFCGR